MGLKAILKKSKFTYAAARTLRKCPYPFLRFFQRAAHALRGVDAKKVYFSSFSGRLYNENPKYVCEALHEICPEAKLVFRLNRAGMRQDDIPAYVTRVPQYSPRTLWHMATARVLVKNACLKPWMLKFPNQTYIQLWHGDRGLKKILFDLRPNAEKIYQEWKCMDIGVSASDFGSRVYMRRAMRFSGELIECGYPKNDVLLANPPEVAAETRRALHLPEGTKVLLYAPTFRDKNIGSAMQAGFSLKKLHAALESSTGEKWLILNRGHSNNAGLRADEGMDVSNFPDVSRLLLVTDMLITDYSSICGDFMLLDRPIILYHADAESYAADDHGLVFDPAASPYQIAHSEAELIEMVCHPADPAENCRALREFYGTKESGHASHTVAERIQKILRS